MPYKGEYIFFGIEGTKGSGNPSTDQHIPMNPLPSHGPQKPKYVDTEERTFDSLDVKYVYTSEKAPGEGPFESSFRDPFMLLTFFTHKVVGGTWVSGIGTITGDFTAVDDVDTIWLRYNVQDLVSTNHVKKLLKYGLPMSYSWVLEPGKVLKEIATYKFLDYETNTVVPSISNDFHDQAWGSGVGGWANWDDTGLGGTGKRSVVDCVIHWGGAVLTALKGLTITLLLEVGSETVQTTDSLAHGVDWKSVRNYSLTISGKLNDLTAITEFEKLYSARTVQDMIFYIDKTSTKEKYIQVTNMHMSPESDITPIPEAGQTAEVNLVLKGGEGSIASFSGKYDTLVDPSALITLSP